ncbi:Tigger transposable element-derived protein 6 OS=Homo sapiens GN=TIGD6 PE=2 SV=2 [Rhizoctonia solani AG-1 IB]|uniref:Tigger transposable element-derived protein 6 n=1 Tax=Thanatephorus cucumeris (strain AG1-IB / isolate 7/3/14) TaxID=1108050 RepID=M5C9F2_THACB|nr:Tigger transposable element-derived protein 6 [Rhizoctonia solani AG-1 IB]CEL55985.1 Tigger transposable element-derived protein 6 OS=Homo sapiens GN=TIGD6 PE=2 SV=2 [Rhizoctonia solani AG-1 IB]
MVAAMAMSQAPAASTPTRQRLSFVQQLKVVEMYHEFKHLGSNAVISRVRRAGFVTVCMQTIRRYVREEPQIRRYLTEHIDRSNRSTRRSSISLPQVEKALWVWIEDAERRNLLVTGELIKSKARRTAIEMGIPPHQMIEFSDGWLTRFKGRYGLKERVFHGEAASAPVELIEPAQKVLQDLIRGYSLKDVINVDETAHFSRQVGNRALASKPLAGSKVDKTRLTVVLGTSAAGGKLPPFVIGHAARPRAFVCGTPAEYGFWYAHNKTAWMTAELFDGYLATVNSWAQHENRHLLLIVDNASSHKHTPDKYSHIKVAYLPPNLTSHIQPMDAGIIKSFKTNYRKLLNEHALDLDARGVANPYRVNQLESMQMLTCAWDGVLETTIQNCWRHTGILPKDDSEELEDMFAHARL